MSDATSTTTIRARPACEPVASDAAAYVDASFAVVRALRDAPSPADAAGAVVRALRSVTGARSVTLSFPTGEGLEVAARAGDDDAERDVVPLVCDDTLAGVLEISGGARGEAFRALVAELAEELARGGAGQDRSRFSDLLTRAPALIGLLRGPDHVFEYVNERVRRVLGGRDILGVPLRDVPVPRELVAVVERVYATGARADGHEVPMSFDWDLDGEPYERHFNVVHEPLRDRDGRVEGVMSFGFDVTDLVEARRRLEAAIGELEATSRAKDEFLATVSHEIRTPLSSIMGWSALLHDRRDEPSVVAKGADVIRRNARAQSKIIEDILDVSRIITGKLRIDVRPVDVDAVARDALEVVRPTAAAKQITLTLKASADPILVVGDEGRLRQVVWNLLSNAIKFTDRGGAVALRVWSEPGVARVEVTDTGRGIAPDFVPHVFERFRQADSSTTRAHGGLGLGLAIVRHLVELHGGTVEAKSEGLGLGATFSVSLPTEAPDGGSSPRSTVRGLPESAESLRDVGRAGPLEDVRVLVVDDEQDARDMLAMILEESGAWVMTAASAREALEIADARLPDVVVSDIGMPVEDGYAFVKRLRALCEERAVRVAAVALTAYARVEDAARAIAAGFDFHVSKPVEPEDLRRVVERAANRGR